MFQDPEPPARTALIAHPMALGKGVGVVFLSCCTFGHAVTVIMNFLLISILGISEQNMAQTSVREGAVPVLYYSGKER